MKKGKAFLDALDRKAKLFAGSARANCDANDELCSWILDPLATWAEAAYGASVITESARPWATSWKADGVSWVVTILACGSCCRTNSSGMVPT